MSISAILIANRGEIAIRIARAAADLGLRTVAVYSEDDADSLHLRVADETQALSGLGAAAYLDMDGIITAARAADCDAVHPGYGFLAERGDFASKCAEAGLTYIGPGVAHLDLFGDKARARAAAVAADVPVLQGLDKAVTLEEATAFFEGQIGGGAGGAMIIKAIAGGGGRGTRAVMAADEIAAAYDRCRSEAKAAFGRDEVYVEAFIPRARHIEVQILGDKTGVVAHLGERECSIQRRYQKIVEIAPAPGLDDGLRQQIIDAAVRFAESVEYTNLGTFEFLVDTTDQSFVFIETNARLQVEHTVTEAVTGVDLVQSQIRLAGGATLAELGLDDPAIARPRGHAIQARVNMETFGEDGTLRPGGGTLTVYEAPSGPGVRTDGFGYAGYKTSSAFDSLLAKVICHAPGTKFSDAVARTRRALSEFRLEGVAVNISFLQNILGHEDFASGGTHTRWVDENMAQLAASDGDQRQRYISSGPAELRGADGYAGARIESQDPLALFAH
ncbi:MAG: carbamoyl-phosphate synthase large subunit, partial [Rhodospirillaceae bacterium]|nr:carbamoyl-phosphate synthase large subunit [Rhodospirillaceae bacterium]